MHAPRHRTKALVIVAGTCFAGLALAFSGSDLLRILADGGRHLIELAGGRGSGQDVATARKPASARLAPNPGGGIANADPMTTRDGSGWLRTFTRSGAIDHDNTFFQPIGSNGRSCASCHVQSAAWSMTPGEIRARFVATGGTDPLFRTNDGSNAPNLDVSTVAARRIAYSMPSRMNACASTVAVVVPSPALSEVLDATSFTICAPMFSNASESSISLATDTPSLVMVGAP